MPAVKEHYIGLQSSSHFLSFVDETISNIIVSIEKNCLLSPMNVYCHIASHICAEFFAE